MDNYQYGLIHVIEYWILNEQLIDRIHEEFFHSQEDHRLVQESNEYLEISLFNSFENPKSFLLTHCHMIQHRQSFIGIQQRSSNTG